MHWIILGRIFDQAKSAYESAQIVFRVDYSRGVPTGLIYVTRRVKSADGNSPSRARS